MNHDLELAKHTARVMDAVMELCAPADLQHEAVVPVNAVLGGVTRLRRRVGGYNSARPALRKGYDMFIWFDMDAEGGYPRFVEMRRGGKRTDLIPFADLTADGQIACEEEVRAYLNDGYGT